MNAGRLKDAQLRLEFARIYLREIAADGMEGVDGQFAYHYAVRAEIEAQRNYALILCEYIQNQAG